MRRLALFAGAAMLAASAARAQPFIRQPFSVPGVPLDVEIAQAGDLATSAWIGVGTQTGYGIIQGLPGNMTVAPHPGGGNINYTSVYRNPAACEELVYENPQGYTWDSVCGVPTGIVSDTNNIAGNGTVLRLRHFPSGRALAHVDVGGSGYEVWFGSGARTSPDAWAAIWSGSLIPANSDVLGVFQDGVVEYGLGVRPTGTAYLVWDGGFGSEGGSYVPSFSAVAQTNEVSLHRDGGLVALFAADTGLYLADFRSSGTPQMTTPVATSLVGQRVTGVSFHTETGDSYGDGFGMAVTASGVYGAVPDPARPAGQWIPRVELALQAPAQLMRVACSGAVLCAFTSDQGSGNNVLVYSNLHPPSLSPDAPTLFDDAPLPTVLNSGVSDLDSDPVFLTWWFDTGAPLSATMLPTQYPQHDRIYVQPTALECSPGGIATYPLHYTVTDGYGPHTDAGTTTVTLRHRFAPATPDIWPDPAVHLAAGEGATVFHALRHDGGCPLASLTWSGPPSDGGYDIAMSLDTLSITPPPTLCQQDRLTYTATADDGTLVTDKTVTFYVDPWGAPDASFPEDAGMVQPGDSGYSYTPWATHACADAGGFPGVTTEWILDPTAPVAPRATVSGQPVDSGVVTAQALTLAFPDCTDETYVLGARNLLLDGGYPGPPSSLTIHVSTPMVDVQSASVSLDASYDPLSLSVVGDIRSDANCATQRGFQGHLEVRHPTLGTVGSASGPYPGTYSAPVSLGCAGGLFSAVAWLSDPDGGVSAPTAVDVDLPKLDAGATLTGGVLTAQCGAGAVGTVAAAFPAGTCPSSEVSWSQDDGPELQPVPDGMSATFRTVDGGLDGLIGAWVHVRATVDGGADNVAEVVQPLQIVPDRPFVGLVHDTDAPVAEEAGILGVRVRMTNETDCPVTRVSLHERAKDLRYVFGTARLDGVPLEPSSVEPELVFDDISLAAHQTRTLTYSGRPAMLGSVRPEGWASMNDVAVSETRGLTPPPIGPCGCGQAPDGAVAWAVALLAWAARRRLRARS